MTPIARAAVALHQAEADRLAAMIAAGVSPVARRETGHAVCRQLRAALTTGGSGMSMTTSHLDR